MYLIVLVVMFWTWPLSAFAKINVFACEPEWASLVSELAGERVDVFSATKATQDPHYLRAKPSFLAAMRKADIVVCSGAGLEVGWLPVLLQKAGGAHVQEGRVGHFMASDYVPILEVPSRVDRAEGDVHPEGNPHIHLNPYNIIKVAQALALRLNEIDGHDYIPRLEIFTQKWLSSIKVWEDKASSLQGKGFVPYHKSWVYLADWLKLEEVAQLEPKPGLPPTPKHLESVLEKVKLKKAAFIIHTPYVDDKAAHWLGEKSGIAVIRLPYTVGGDEDSSDLFKMYDRTINLLLDAQL